METTQNNPDNQKRGACGKICATCGLCDAIKNLQHGSATNSASSR